MALLCGFLKLYCQKKHNTKSELVEDTNSFKCGSGLFTESIHYSSTLRAFSAVKTINELSELEAIDTLDVFKGTFSRTVGTA